MANQLFESFFNQYGGTKDKPKMHAEFIYGTSATTNQKISPYKNYGELFL